MTRASRPHTPVDQSQPDEVLLIYYWPTPRWYRDASTINEHIDAFKRYSRFPVRAINSDYGFPQGLQGARIGAIILHYSLFGQYLRLGHEFSRFVASSKAYKVAFFQDEHHHCGLRFRFIDEHGIDCVYSCLPPEHFGDVYGSYTQASEIRFNLPGYVSEEIIENARRFATPDAQRPIDVGYRGRPLAPYMGRGGAEKLEIGTGFARRAAATDLVIDIDCSEEGRLYGDDWPLFLARCKAVLGVESGVSVFDLEDAVWNEHLRLSREGIQRSATEWESGPFGRWFGKIRYRTISPRHFEAAAMRVCQILFEGEYSGAMKPMVHYIPLRQDFANFDEVVRLVRDPAVRRELTDNAHRDLIASGRYGYDRLIADFDRTLVDAGLRAAETAIEPVLVDAALRRGRLGRHARTRARWGAWRTRARAQRGTSLVTNAVSRLLDRPRRDGRT